MHFIDGYDIGMPQLCRGASLANKLLCLSCVQLAFAVVVLGQGRLAREHGASPEPGQETQDDEFR